MKIYLHEITDQDKALVFDQSTPWLVQILESLDESEIPKPKQGPRVARAELHLRKVDEVVVTSGDIQGQAHLLCSRCTIPFTLPIQTRFSALFCKDPVMAGVADDRGGSRGSHGKARHAHAEPSASSWTESGEDLDITYLSHDFIDLSDVLTEQLQLQMPFQPLCKEDCKGICAHCGADLNRGRCACAQVNKNLPGKASVATGGFPERHNPFSVLQRLPKPSKPK